jgi:hypothetical protein
LVGKKESSDRDRRYDIVRYQERRRGELEKRKIKKCRYGKTKKWVD